MTQGGKESQLQTLRRSKAVLERICQLPGEIARLENERSTLKRIVDIAVEVVGVDAAHLALVDRSARSLYGIISSGRHRDDAPRLQLLLSQSPAAETALREGRPVAIADAVGNPRVNRYACKRLTVGSVAYLPLHSGNESFGLLILVRHQPGAWSSSELRLARYCADMTSVAFENSRLLARLAETEGRFQSLVEHMPVIIYTCDVDPPFRVRSIDTTAESLLLGYSLEDWRKDPGLFMKLVHPEDGDRVVAMAARVKHGSMPVAEEYRMLDQHGDIRWFRDESVLVRDPAGNPVAWHGVVVEITGIKGVQRPVAPRSALGPGSSRRRPEQHRKEV